jgi:hypothetical protein
METNELHNKMMTFKLLLIYFDHFQYLNFIYLLKLRLSYYG